MSDILNINQCNIAQTLGESNRFLFHVMLVHFATCIIEGKKAFFGEELFRTLLITAMAIAMYHVFFRKIMEPKIEKMKLICYDDEDRISKKKELSKQHSEFKHFKKPDEFEIIDRKYTKKYKKSKRDKDKRNPRNYSTRQQVLHD